MHKINSNIRQSSINTYRIQENVGIFHQFCKYLCTTSRKNTAEEKVGETNEQPFDILEELKEQELTENEILQKRFKARLPERIYKMKILKQAIPPTAYYDFKMCRLRRHWATFGSSSNLNPGICWPTREQILETLEYDKTFEPPLEARLRNVQEKRQLDFKAKQDYEAEVNRNMANNDKWISEYYAKIRKNEEKVRELRIAREKLVEEISEYLGYDIDPRDPRFKEAVEQRDKERKKALKAQKQKESYDKMLDKLKKIAQQNKP